MFFDRELIFMKRILEKTNINLFVIDYDAQIKNNIKKHLPRLAGLCR